MNLTERDTSLVFSIMQDLSGEFAHAEVRQRVCKALLDLLQADYFAPSVWDDNIGVPGISLPCQGAGSLPVGIEFDARPGQDRALLALARAAEWALAAA